MPSTTPSPTLPATPDTPSSTPSPDSGSSNTGLGGSTSSTTSTTPATPSPPAQGSNAPPSSPTSPPSPLTQAPPPSSLTPGESCSFEFVLVFSHVHDLPSVQNFSQYSSQKHANPSKQTLQGLGKEHDHLRILMQKAYKHVQYLYQKQDKLRKSPCKEHKLLSCSSLSYI